MKRSNKRWLYLLMFVLLGNAMNLAAAADRVDAKALSIAQQTQVLVKLKGDSALRTAAEFTERNQLLDAATALQAQVEAGQAELSSAPQQQLTQATDRLQGVPVEYSLLGRAVRANGTLSGTITDALSGLAITTANAVRVQAVDFSSQITPTGAGIVNNVGINASGQYTLTLPPGNYHIRTFSNSLGYINQAFGFGNCPDSQSCPRYVGTIVPVPDGGVAPAVDFSMPLGARISGNVKRSDTNANVVGVFVVASNENAFGGLGASTDASGNYTISGLVPGRYRAVANSNPTLPGFLNETWNNLPCGDSDCDRISGYGLVTVAGTATTSGIDFTLEPGAASVSGVITEAGTGTPIVDDGSFTALAYLLSEDRATYASVDLKAGGVFTFPKLRPGNYRLSASAPGYIGKVLSGLSPIATRDCSDPVACDVLDIGVAIMVPAAGTVTGLNFTLERGASFSGTVRSAVGATPINAATVSVRNAVNGATASTDAAGNFTVRGLPAGVYYATADAPNQNFVQTWLGDVTCRGFFCANVGVPVTITANAAITGQIFNMPVGGNLTGVIIDGATGFPAPRQTRLELFDTLGRNVAQVFPTGVSGYNATGLPPGAYKAVFASTSVLGWIDTAFGGLPCPRGGCDLSLLPTVFVTAGATTAGIGATLPRGARISGRVTDAATGQAIRVPAFGSGFSFTIAFNNNLSNYAGFGSIDGAGNYTSRTGFSPGPYFLSSFLLRNNTPIGGGYIDELYNDLPCPYASCGLTSGTAINVGAVDIGGFDMALSQGGAITGTVVNAVGSSPLFGVELKAFNSSGDLVAIARSNPNGKYRLEALPPGSYYLSTNNSLGFQDELYNGQSCEPFCNPVNGTAVNVVGTATTTGRNFSLEQSVSVSGIVSNSGPAANVAVEIYGQIGNLLRSTVSNASGSYTFADLAPGRFYVRTRNLLGRTDDLYYQAGNANNTSASKPDCVGLACQIRRGTPIDVIAGASFTDANLTLLAPGQISGVITNAASSATMSGVTLELLDARGALVGSASSSAAGVYNFSALSAGNYYLVSRGTPGFVDLAFPNSPCPSSCNGLNGSAIAVSTGASVSGINLALASGGSISGTVRNSATNLPIPGATVQVYNATAVPVAQIATNPSGNYELSNVANGNFFVRTQNALGFVNEVFNNRACGGYCDLLNGNPVNITGGVPVGLIDFSLDAGGSISGRLTNASTSNGIALAEVLAIDINGLIASRSNTNATGNYTLGGLQPGNYKLRTSNTAGFVNQIYRTPAPLSCSPSPCLVAAGSVITVAGAVSGINLALTPGGTISGTAADLFNNPLPSGTAVLLDSTGIEVISNPIVNGLFEFNGLANGSYYVLIRNNSGLIDLLYPNAPCPGGACNITAVGTPITLAALRSVNATANIDLRLPAGRAVAGRVTRAGQALTGVTVYFYDSTGAVVASGTTDALGDYVSNASLPAGVANSYFAATSSPTQRGAGAGLINEAWNNVPCMLNCGIASIATAIPLPAGIAPLSGIDFDLQAGGALRGVVRNSSGNPLSLVTVLVVDSAGRAVGSGQSDSLGNYSVDGLVPGTYFARTSNALGLQDVLFGGATCAVGCNPLLGTAISVVGTNSTGAVDFSLNQPDPLFRNGFE